MATQQPTLANQKPFQPPQAYMHISACMVEKARVYTENYQEPLHTHTPPFSGSCIKWTRACENHGKSEIMEQV